MLSYSFYEPDARVRRYAETLARRGDQIDVVALAKQKPGSCRRFRGVNLYTLQIRKLNEKGKLSYLIRMLKFLLKSALFLTIQHLKKSYRFVHVHNMPDFLVFAGFLPKLLGAKIILDIHDIQPECYAIKFNGVPMGLTYRLLVLVEKISCAFADHVIVSNHIWQKTLIGRSVRKEKCTVILNYPDESIFYKRPRTRIDNKFIIIYPGSLVWLQGIDIVIKAFSSIIEQVPASEFHIYGGGHEQGALEGLVSDLKLHDRVFFHKSVPLSELPEIVANADLGIAPTRDYGFANEALSTKIMEFMALGIPVIASDTKVNRYYFNNNVLKFFRAGDKNSLAESMLLLIRDNDLRKRLVSNAGKFIEGYLWKDKKDEYLSLVDSLNRNS